MNVITFLNEKGGVAKTTCAVHLAAGLAFMGYDVLVVDSDAQAHATQQLGLEEAGGLYRMLVQDARIKEVARTPDPKVWGATAKSGRLRVIPSNIETRAITSALGDQEADYLRDTLATLAGAIDFVVIDTSPTPSLLHSMIYLASDYLVMPAIPDALALDGLGKTSMRVAKHNEFRRMYGLEPLQILAVQPTLVSGYLRGAKVVTTEAHQYGLKLIREQFGDEKVLPPIMTRTKWRDASYARQTVYAYAPDSDAAREAWAMVEAVEGKLNGAAHAVA